MKKQLDRLVARIVPKSWYKTDDGWRNFSQGMYFGIVLSFLAYVILKVLL